MEKINKAFLEKIIIKSLITNTKFMSRIVDNLNNIFSIEEYNTVSSFYKNFWQTHGKLPSNAELKLYITDEKIGKALNKVIIDTKNISLNEINDEILYSNAEQFVKEKLAINTLFNVVEKYQNNEIDPSELVERFEKIAGISFSFDKGYEIYNDIDKYITSLKATENRIPTGFIDIDKNINGGVLGDRKMFIYCYRTHKCR